jgi:DNA-binding NtrC family response regulator
VIDGCSRYRREACDSFQGTRSNVSFVTIPARRVIGLKTRPDNIATMLDIVIYEEDCLTHALIREWLSEAGYRVHNGAPRNALPNCPANLVIVSVYMPKHVGARCVRDIQAAHPGTPLIAISGQFRSGLSAAGATAQTLGVQQVIAKPLMRGDLLEAVRGMIGTPT